MTALSVVGVKKGTKMSIHWINIGPWKLVFLLEKSLNFVGLKLYEPCFIGADPTLKDDSGHTAVEYAGNLKIKELLNVKMETVFISNL